MAMTDGRLWGVGEPRVRERRRAARRALRCLACVLLLADPSARATAPATSPPAAQRLDAAEQLADIMVEAREPRFVAPTRRDHIGRIWAPVFINGHGPFRMVLDTGASHSGVTAMVALALGIPTDQSPPVLLRGVTGAATVPTIRVDTLNVGDVSVDSTMLPIVPDAMGGAEGILGSEGLADKRIFIDFRHDQIVIAYSRDERPERGFVTVPFHSMHGQLIVVDTTIGGVSAQAIIDTGGQTTIANLALRDALASRSQSRWGKRDEIIGASLDVQQGELTTMPPVEFGTLRIESAGVTFADMYIFKQWHMTSRPAILIGMDALGLLDTLVIDYRRHEVQMRTAAAR